MTRDPFLLAVYACLVIAAALAWYSLDIGKDYSAYDIFRFTWEVR